jgi:GDPmannose 4,6-dehydratase
MSKTVIVSGVTGQAGSYFVDYLLENTDYMIYGTIRRLSVNNHKNIAHIKDPRFKLITMDLSDPISIEEVIRKYKPDYFINAAANSFVGSSWTLAAQHMQCNAMGVLYILEAIKNHSPNTRFYNFGSSEEMGDVLYSPQDEQHPPRARSPYGASKIAARQLIKVYRESFNLYCLQGWSWNYESERRGDEFVTRKITKGVARIYNDILNSKQFKPICLGNLESRRDWSHCTDIVDGVWRMLNQEKYNPKLLGRKNDYLPSHIKEYVLASNTNHSVKEFVEKAFKVAGIEGDWYNNSLSEPLDERYYMKNQEAEEAAEAMGDFDIIDEECSLVKIDPKLFRPADVETLQGSYDAIKRDLGWEPKVKFDELVARMVKNDIENYV